MNSELSTQKVTASHLQRDAYLYVRQSTLRQVLENAESTHRQYALRERAVALGWPIERVTVIDHDQAQSGASAADRAGFQRLVTEVGLGRAGIVLGLEVSRLARNCADWHRLLEICALSDTLILDEDGLYDPSHFNDRLLLGLKGTMSEAELHVLGARLQGGIRNKARRGELQSPLPVGLVYDLQGRVALDPDQQVQQTLRTFFQTYERTGSAMATVKSSDANGCCSRVACVAAAARESSFGDRWFTAARCKSCTTRGTRARSRSVGRGNANSEMGTSNPTSCHRSNGIRSCRACIRATSLGNNFRSINSGCAMRRRATEKTVGMARPVKAPRCCKGWCSAACVDSE